MKISGYAWGIIAVLFWSTAASVGGALAGHANFFQIVLLMQAAALVILAAAAVRDLPVLTRDIAKIVAEQKFVPAFALLVVMASAITAYHLSFYFALQNAPRIQANIINYLWPLILFVLTALLFGRAERRLGLYEYALVALAFFGAVTIAWDPASGLAKISLTDGMGAAFLAALTAPIYMLASVVLRRRYFSRSYFPYLCAFLLSFPILTAVAAANGLSIAPPDRSSWPLIIYLGVASVAIAHFAWTKAIDEGPAVMVTNLAYLVPVLSTLLLMAVFHDQPSPKILFGATLILIANLLSNEAFHRIYAEAGALIAFFLVSFLVYFKHELGLAGLAINSIDYVGQIFAIISGFFLARMWQKNKEEQEKLVAFATEVDGAVERAKNGGKALSPALVRAVDDAMVAVSDFDVCRSHAERAVLTAKTKAAAESLIGALRDVEGDGLEAQLLHTRLRAMLNGWIVQKFDRASVGEVVIVGILGFVGAFVVLTSAEGILTDIVALIFSACVAYIVLKVRDYNNMVSISDYSRLLIIQAPLHQAGLPYYVPEHYLLYNKLRPSELGSVVRYRNKEGVIVETGADTTSVSLEDYHRSRIILTSALAVGVASVLLLLLQKYH